MTGIAIPAATQELTVSILEPAPLAFDAAGVPWSPRYGDIYHSADSGPGQARHVFIGGNDLPKRWRGRQAFTILETGFGLGLNFLATLREWHDDAQRCGRLHYVAVEKHPFSVESLASLHARYAEFEHLAAELRSAWPMLVPGVHRLSLAGGRVLLTLALGDAAVVLPRLSVSPDAIYLDGFAPARNPDMWSVATVKQLARKAYPGTTLSTYSSAAAVRRALQDEGFICEKRSGFGHKREMLCAHYAPRGPRRAALAASVAAHPRHALVIGAGLAGAALCERLASRGWQIDLLESAPAPASGGSGLHAGAFHPHVSPDDCLLSRLSRNAFLQGLARWHALEAAGHRIAWARCGVLQMPRASEPEDRLMRTLAALAYPAGYAEFVSMHRAGELAGLRVSGGGCWFAQGGWLRATTLVAAQLAAGHAHTHALFGQNVHRLLRHNRQWQALAQDGRLMAAAPVAILANAAGAQTLAALGAPLRRIRGTVTLLAPPLPVAPRIVVSGTGYVLPPVDGLLVAGSSYETEEAKAQPASEAHGGNLARLARLLPDFPAALSPGTLTGNYAERAVARDRLPLVGAVPDIEAARAAQGRLAGAQLSDLPRMEDLYCATGFGSRGIIWSALAGELLASQLEGEPLPVESDLAAAIDPGRFALRALRHGRL